jgi:preprotein translocase subunit SecY
MSKFVLLGVLLLAGFIFTSSLCEWVVKRRRVIGAIVIIGLSVMILGLILFICLMERAQRHVLVQYSKRASVAGLNRLSNQRTLPPPLKR